MLKESSLSAPEKAGQKSHWQTLVNLRLHIWIGGMWQFSFVVFSFAWPENPFGKYNVRMNQNSSWKLSTILRKWLDKFSFYITACAIDLHQARPEKNFFANFYFISHELCFRVALSQANASGLCEDAQRVYSVPGTRGLGRWAQANCPRTRG